MKKLLLVLLVIVLTCACALNAFAWSAFHVVEFSKCPEGLPINAKVGTGTSSGTLTIRNDWSVNRNADNNTSVDSPNDSWNYNSVVVTDDDGFDEFLVAEVVAPQAFVSKYTGYSDFEVGDTFAFELKKGDVTEFAGAVLNFGALDILPQAQKTTNIDDYFLTTYGAKSVENAKLALATGYGFTFLPDSNTKVRVFVRCLNSADLDIIYYDIDLGVDLTANYYTYCFYYENGSTKFAVADALDNEVFYNQGSGTGSPFPEDAEIGGKVCATITFSNPQNVSEKIDGNALTQKYCRTAAILDGTGKEVASTETALISSGEKNDAALCFLGEGTKCRVKTLIWTDMLFAPNETFPETNPTAAPETTEAPATEAPVTEAPATEAPATEAPATEEPEDGAQKTGGCGGIIGTGVFAVSLFAVMTLKKKKEQ